MNNESKVKADLLLKCSRKDPVRYKQYDAFTDPKCFDDDIKPWGDGVAYFSTETDELMHGSNVRVLIRHDTSHAEALKAIKGILNWLKEFKCDRCGGQYNVHHDACRDDSLTAEQVQAVMYR